MNALQYKEETKCKVGAVLTALVLLGIFYIDGGSILSGFSGMKNIWLYILVRDILPVILILAAVVMMFVKKDVPKFAIMLLSSYFFVDLFGQFVLLSQEKVYFGFMFTAENLIKLVVNVLAILFTLMTMFGAIKASAGSLCVTLARGVLVFFNLYVLSSFVMAVLIAAFAMFLLSSVEDYKEKPLKKITGESINFARRNVGSCIILTILTLGIFGIVWLTKICKDLNRLHGDENPVGSEVLLYLLVPFYSVYWGYAKGKQMYDDSKKRGGNLTNRKFVYLFMNLLFMQLFTLGFIQTQLNSYQHR